MAKTFEIRTEPHEVVIGTDSLYFQPEANGAQFLQAYARLRGVDSDSEALEAGDPEAALRVLESFSEFIRKFLMSGSVEVFDRLDLPLRILVAIVEHLAELYGGGSEGRPTTSSNGSAVRRRKPGARG